MRSRSRRITNLAAEKAISSMRYSVSNTAEYGCPIRRLRVVGRRRGQPCREPHRQEGLAGQAP
jgi:ketol-acid reductoisomerase